MPERSAAIVVLSGPPGAGKSTIARELARGYDRAVHLHTDDFWNCIVAGSIPPYEPASADQNRVVIDVAAGAAVTYARGGFTVIVDGVVGPWVLDQYLRAARAHPSIALHYVVLRPDREVVVARAQRRTSPGALTGLAPLVSMWDQFADLGDLEPHVLDTSDQDVPTSVAVVRAMVGSERVALRPR